MRVSQENIVTPTKEKDGVVHRLAQDVYRVLQDLIYALNGRLGFGDGVSPDNMVGEWITFTSSATPNAENAIAHGLGDVPCGFIVMIPPKAGTVNQGTTSWSATHIYLKVAASSETVKIFLLPRTSE